MNFTYNELGQPTSMRCGDAGHADDVKHTALGDPERYELGNIHYMDIINTFEAGTRGRHHRLVHLGRRGIVGFP